MVAAAPSLSPQSQWVIASGQVLTPDSLSRLSHANVHWFPSQPATETQASRWALGIICLGLTIGLGVLALPFLPSFSQPRILPGTHQHTTVDVRLLSLNIQHGGNIHSVAQVIRESKADIVALQEVEGHLQEIAAQLGWYYDLTSHIVSRFPLVSSSQSTAEAAFSYAIVDGEDGLISIANMHLTPYPYGPELALNGATLSDILDAEMRYRLPAVMAISEKLAHHTHVPTFILGDFNSPSHLDWTAATVGLRPQIKFAVTWPCTRILEAALFNDTYRIMHPSPRSDAGLTWWAKETNATENGWSDADPSDRIDYVFSRDAMIMSSDIVGEIEGPGVNVAVTPWTTDHRGIIAVFKVAPADLAPWISVPHAYVSEGTTIPIRFSLVSHSSAILVIVSQSTGLEWTRSGDLLNHGTFEVSTVGWPDGDYDVFLESTNGKMMRRTVFALLAVDVTPCITVSCVECDSNGPVAITWTAAPGNRYDWIALVSVEHGTTKMWRYAHNHVDGVWHLTTPELHELPSGHYTAHLLKDNTPFLLAESTPFAFMQHEARTHSPLPSHTPAVASAATTSESGATDSDSSSTGSNYEPSTDESDSGSSSSTTAKFVLHRAYARR